MRGPAVTDPFVRKLRHGVRLEADDEAALAALVKQTKAFGPHRDFNAHGTTPRTLPIILEGWACRYRLLENGKRQLTALYLPGDLCEPFGVPPRYATSAFGALTHVVIASAPLASIEAAAQCSPIVRDALWWDLSMASSIDQERLVSIGRRTATERIGHLICELHVRLAMVGLAGHQGCDLLITQADMADLLGLTPVHVNRSLRSLRETGLISMQGRRVTIHDLPGLRQLCFFDPSYLHIGGIAAE